MSGQNDGIGEWIDKRGRKLRAEIGRRFRSVQLPATPTICLFCDFEGHYAGASGEKYADIGTDRLLDLLERCGLKITFNVVADLCKTHPERVKRIRAAGHEIACHGWKHESPRDLSDDETIEMLQKAVAAFESLKIVPSGFRSPRSAWSSSLVRYLPHYQFEWNAERDGAWRPYRIHDLMFRVSVKTDDWDLVDGTSDAAGLFEKWRGVVAETKGNSGCIAIGVHEWIVGMESAYAEGLESFVRELQSDESMQISGIGDALPETG